MKYYAVAKGFKTGIFTNWEETKQYVHKYPGAKYKSFPTKDQAIEFLKQNGMSDEDLSFLNEDNIKEIKDNIKEETITFCEKPKREKIYTDGSCIDKIGGYGYVFVNTEPDCEKYCGKVPINPCTNQIAELYAIYQALNNCPFNFIDLYTDSKYSMGCLTEWWFRWTQNGWKNSKGQTVANKELIQSILIILRNKDVKFHHVFGHSGDKFNDMCDELADLGRKM